MALQGTIDSFALADVLRLLNTSSKSGRLIVNGDRGSASMWIADGEIVGGGTSGDPSAPDVVDVVFDVLRYQAGSFIFENDAACPNPGPGVPIVPALEQAEAALAEWYEIVRVVPSLDSRVVLAEVLPHPEVVVDQACWTSVVAVGSGISVEDLGETLGLGELPVCRLVRALVSAGFVNVVAATEATESWSEDGTGSDLVVSSGDGTEGSGGTDDAWTSTTTESWDHFENVGVASDDEGAVASEVASTDAGEPDESTSPDSVSPFEPTDFEVADPGLTIAGLDDDPFAPDPSPESDDESADGDDWEQALSMLSPAAAQAVAAASEDGTTDDDEWGRA